MGQLRIPMNTVILWFRSYGQSTKTTVRESFIVLLNLQCVISTEEQRAGLRSWTNYLSLLEITLVMLLALRTRNACGRQTSTPVSRKKMTAGTSTGLHATRGSHS